MLCIVARGQVEQGAGRLHREQHDCCSSTQQPLTGWVGPLGLTRAILEVHLKYIPQDHAVEIHESEFPGCCGIVVAHEAEYEADADLTKAMQALVAGEDTEHVNTDKGLILYSLNDSQKVEKAAVLGAGFVPITDFISPSTQNHVTLYARKINQPAATRRRR